MDDHTPRVIEFQFKDQLICRVDSTDTDLFQGRKWHILPVHRHRYLRSRLKGTVFLLHRVIMERVLQRSLVTGEVVDHIDGDSLNNCRSNLRLATHQQNTRNRCRHKNNKSGFKGVYKDSRSGRRGWRAQITLDGKIIRLGTFKTPELAHQAYCEAAVRLHGEFARLS